MYNNKIDIQKHEIARQKDEIDRQKHEILSLKMEFAIMKKELKSSSQTSKFYENKANFQQSDKLAYIQDLKDLKEETDYQIASLKMELARWTRHEMSHQARKARNWLEREMAAARIQAHVRRRRDVKKVAKVRINSYRNTLMKNVKEDPVLI